MYRRKLLIWACAAILLLGIAGSIGLLLAPHGTRVNIVRDGMILYTFDLAVAEDQTLEIEYEGRTNTVQIEDGRIRMLEAECPDQTCVRMNWLRSRALPLVCLPNHLIIEYVETEDDVDAVIR